MLFYARATNGPVRVSMRIRSPSLRYSGTWTMRPVSSVAGLVREVAELPLMAWIALRDQEIDSRGKLHADAFAVVDQGEHALQIFRHVLHFVGDIGARDGDIGCNRPCRES